MFKIASGRRRESAVWRYFIHDRIAAKSKCVVCDFKLSGKNPTNLKTHLSTYHQAEYKIVEKSDEDNKRQNSTASAGVEAQSTLNQFQSRFSSNSSQGIMCMFKTTVQWSEESLEYKFRLQTLIDLFILARLPVSLVDNPAFRSFYTALEPKFPLPRK